MKKIVTHKAPHHLDEVVAVSLIYERGDEIIKISPQDPVPDADLVIDVGMKYDGKKYFDHHQSVDLPSSAVLIAKALNVPDGIMQYLQEVSNQDTKGVCDYEKLTRFLTAIVISVFEEDPEILAKVLKKIITIEKEKEELFRQVETFYIGNLKVCVFRKVPPPGFIQELFAKTNAHLLFCVNQFNSNHTSIIKNTKLYETKSIDLSKVPNKVFIHATGFMCVVNTPIDQVNVADIVKLVQ